MCWIRAETEFCKKVDLQVHTWVFDHWLILVLQTSLEKVISVKRSSKCMLRVAKISVVLHSLHGGVGHCDLIYLTFVLARGLLSDINYVQIPSVGGLPSDKIN